MDPYKLSVDSEKEAYFKCDNGHSFKMKIRDFCDDPKCIVCARMDDAKSSLRVPTLGASAFWVKGLNDFLRLDDASYCKKTKESHNWRNRFFYPLSIHVLIVTIAKFCQGIIRFR